MKIKALFIAMLCTSVVSAQLTNPLGQQMLTLTQNLDFQEVSSGILFDRGTQLALPAGFDGSSSSDTLYSYDDWYLQYGAIKGTFHFTVTDTNALDTFRITDGSFRFDVPQIF
ncbi:hypothetical protein G3O08_19095 [Cryomorpha ignava]|uniref:Uncharacterized protein n=1 Tax=Cryomorpha ignava TaxID=101383 RepID=A0A7K3WV79_9FLAO|nr:hypothetical protein [Cryomorpha ignava]NEN25603.1 hypothetical protein [Cryomorpha ignava]